MADTAFGLASFEATTRCTCVLYCHSTLYSKLSCISAKITGFYVMYCSLLGLRICFGWCRCLS